MLIDEEGKLLNVNLDLKNPSKKSEFEYQEPSVLVNSILEKEKTIINLMKEIESEINIEPVTKWKIGNHIV